MKSCQILVTNELLRGSHRLRQQQASKEVYRNSFFPRSVRDWNHLPETVLAAPTIEEFRTRLSSIPWTQLQAQYTTQS
uniref:Uncharacterized protein n=1 Tax=Magallana gigas TaxID=29159 RepID=A0A8W8M7U3_MAGGI